MDGSLQLVGIEARAQGPSHYLRPHLRREVLFDACELDGVDQFLFASVDREYLLKD
ncbi:hypothetical protein D3C85_1654270 [compost metagenome]